jgi:hypothetical protein
MAMIKFKRSMLKTITLTIMNSCPKSLMPGSCTELNVYGSKFPNEASTIVKIESKSPWNYFNE